MPEFVLDLRGGSPDLRAALEGAPSPPKPPGCCLLLCFCAGSPALILSSCNCTMHGVTLPVCRCLAAGPLLERAIGVIYRPVTERQSHYFSASLSRQFDAVVHLDTTSGAQLGQASTPSTQDAQ
jgi:hypothetical protein